MFHILIGAVVGAAVGAVAAVVVAKVRGEPVTWQSVVGGAAAGLVGGAVTAATFGAGGAAAVGAGRAVTAFVAGGAAAGASGQATDNVLHDQPILQGVPEATATGAILGGATYGAGRALAPVARRVMGGIRGQPAAGASGSGAAAVTRSATPAASGNAARAGPLAARPSLQAPMGDRVVSNLSGQPVVRQPVASAAAAGRGSATTRAGNTATAVAERPATRGAVDALDDMMGGGRGAASGSGSRGAVAAAGGRFQGTTARQIMADIPEHARARRLTPVAGKVTEGIEYKWVENGATWRVRIHGPDASAPVGSNSVNGWIVRVQRGSKYMDPNGNFHPRGITNPNSPHFNESLANTTHMPIETPGGLGELIR